MAFELRKLSELWKPERPEASEKYSGSSLENLPIYEYSPLVPGQIRLLHVLPGSGAAPISCELHTVDPSSGQFYEAVSYCWGQGGKPCNVEIAGKRLPVTESAVDALWQFRLPQHKRVLWLDAICINQDDLAEKTVQVRMMGSIFGGAFAVLAWVGFRTEGSDRAVAAVSEAQWRLRKIVTLSWLTTAFTPEDDPNTVSARAALDRYFHGYIQTPKDIAFFALMNRDVMNDLFRLRPWWREYDLYLSLGLLTQERSPRSPLLVETHNQLDAILPWQGRFDLYKFVHRPYFERAWVIQEIVLARKVVLCIGDMCIEWDDFATTMIAFLVACAENEFPLADTCSYFQDPQERRSFYQSVGRIPYQMTNSCLYASAHRTSLPVDRLFAFFAISSESNRVDIDYERPAADIFLEAAQTMLRDPEKGGERSEWSRTQWLLGMVDYGDVHETDVLPSWVPNFGTITRANGQHLWTWTTGCGAPPTQIVRWEPSNPRSLSVHGLAIAKIAQLAIDKESVTAGAVDTWKPDIMVNVLSDAQQQWAPSFTLNSLLEALERQSDSNKELFGRLSGQEQAFVTEAKIACQKSTISECARVIKQVTTLIGMATDAEVEDCWRAIALGTAARLRHDLQGFSKSIPAWVRLVRAAPDLALDAGWTPSHPALNRMTNDDLTELFDFVAKYKPWIKTVFCRFDHGQFGWVPERSRIGDTAYAVAGVTRPHIFRTISDGRVKNIGAAYVEGSMTSESMESRWPVADIIMIS
jgi:hypothetical protein